MKYLGGLLLGAFASSCIAAANDGAGASRTQQGKRRAAAQPPQITCAMSPELCMSEPLARGCGDGRHWSAAGSGMAHCVDDNRNCADGKAAKRDEYDNLVCAEEKAGGQGDRWSARKPRRRISRRQSTIRRGSAMKKIFVGLWLAMIAFTAQAQGNCSLSPESCMTAPIAQACPSGKHWTTAGSGIAHCVNVDPVCASSEKVAYDSLGNPSCVSRCSASEYWNGSMCRPCTTTSNAAGSCQSGYTGTAYRSVTTNSCTGSTSYGAWDYSGCTVACTTSNSTQSGSCQSGYTGTAYRSVSTNSCTGATTYGTWDYSSCTQSCGTSSSTQSGSCQSGYSGTAYRSVTTNSCTGSTTYGSWDYSSCSPSAPACGDSTSTEYGSCQSNYTGTASRSVTYNSCTGSTTYGSWNYSGCTYSPVVQPYNMCPNDGQEKYSCTASGAPGSSGKYLRTRYKDNGLNNGGCTASSTQIGTCGYNPSFWANEY